MATPKYTPLPIDGCMHAVGRSGITACGIVIAGRTAGPIPRELACAPCLIAACER